MIVLLAAGTLVLLLTAADVLWAAGIVVLLAADTIVLLAVGTIELLLAVADVLWAAGTVLVYCWQLLWLHFGGLYCCIFGS